VKVELDWDEAYPVYILSEPDDRWPGIMVEVPEELWNRYQAARAEWNAVQDLLAAIPLPKGNRR
jgi:hypothetical protein